jgi:hypothetical protein
MSFRLLTLSQLSLCRVFAVLAFICAAGAESYAQIAHGIRYRSGPMAGQYSREVYVNGEGASSPIILVPKGLNGRGVIDFYYCGKSGMDITNEQIIDTIASRYAK